MKPRAIRAIKQAMMEHGEQWRIPFMEFVDEFRRTRDPRMIAEPFDLNDERMDSLLASTIECLCREIGVEIPNWVWEVPSCKTPWFVSEVDNLKAIALAESPPYFRRRKIFVLENFLSRV